MQVQGGGRAQLGYRPLCSTIDVDTFGSYHHKTFVYPLYLSCELVLRYWRGLRLHNHIRIKLIKQYRHGPVRLLTMRLGRPLTCRRTRVSKVVSLLWHIFPSPSQPIGLAVSERNETAESCPRWHESSVFFVGHPVSGKATKAFDPHIRESGDSSV